MTPIFLDCQAVRLAPLRQEAPTLPLAAARLRQRLALRAALEWRRRRRRFSAARLSLAGRRAAEGAGREAAAAGGRRHWRQGRGERQPPQAQSARSAAPRQVRGQQDLQDEDLAAAALARPR